MNRVPPQLMASPINDDHGYAMGPGGYQLWTTPDVLKKTTSWNHLVKLFSLDNPIWMMSSSDFIRFSPTLARFPQIFIRFHRMSFPQILTRGGGTPRVLNKAARFPTLALGGARRTPKGDLKPRDFWAPDWDRVKHGDGMNLDWKWTISWQSIH